MKTYYAEDVMKVEIMMEYILLAEFSFRKRRLAYDTNVSVCPSYLISLNLIGGYL